MLNQKIKNKDLLNNPKIAEILGAFIGDGWIESDKDALYITGNTTEDKQYYDNHLASLFSKYFAPVKPKKFPYWKVYGIVTYKKEVIKKAISLGFQIGPKSLIAEIPKNILYSNNKDVIKAVLRGIFDTDGSFWCERSRAKTSTEWKKNHNYHPELRITSCSKKLVEQIKYLLNKLDIKSKITQKGKKGFKFGRNINDSYALNIRRKAEIEKWFKIIGTNNPRHKTRHDVWKKIGYLPPYTSIEERITILKKRV
ncbi:MAG: hypothetical protein KKF46_07055 [Nanoarchaeota archaeon]|nr:hypothetical protein [Nanoarchaeota archaeon]MBU1322086.1 hypothetical protein [Nanoarchaeota archaeon]MBU1598192.1 hypothetical protein [Nanoarchaeota archaeon]MBU2441322.1 hypothetical protein [Nanoarchaeota archaeon]